MSDIVERLRSENTLTGYYDPPKLQEDAAKEIEWLREERSRLSLDLAKAHYDALDWMKKSQVFEAALYRIAMPGRDIGYCRDGHEIAVLIARDALKEGSLG